MCVFLENEQPPVSASFGEWKFMVYPRVLSVVLGISSCSLTTPPCEGGPGILPIFWMEKLSLGDGEGTGPSHTEEQ